VLNIITKIKKLLNHENDLELCNCSWDVCQPILKFISKLASLARTNEVAHFPDSELSFFPSICVPMMFDLSWH